MHRSIHSLLLFVISGATTASIGANMPAPAAPTARLEISLVVTANGKELFESWERPTGKPFRVEPVKVAARGRFLSAVVLFKGCKPDAAGNCNIEVDFVAYDPKGAVYGDMKNAELWQSKPAPTRGKTQLGVNYMGIVIEPKDIAGKYRVVATARDKNANEEANAAATFEVR